MQPARHLLSVLALAMLPALSFATTVTYTNSAAFLANVGAGSYTNTFTGLSDASSGLFSGGGFSYKASAPSDIYVSAGFLGTNQIDEVLTIDFTSGNVTAIGANFFATDISDAFQSVSLTVALDDGTTTTFTPSSIADGFRGFTSDHIITQLTISAPGASLYSGLDDLTVGVSKIGATVPEPTSWMLVSLALFGAFFTRRRRI